MLFDLAFENIYTNIWEIIDKWGKLCVYSEYWEMNNKNESTDLKADEDSREKYRTKAEIMCYLCQYFPTLTLQLHVMYFYYSWMSEFYFEYIFIYLCISAYSSFFSL